ncbi:hypothetical protein EDC04DRAFT_3086661 [Pisolithus marmoratus]|nr:hypothetical protein EDC04DRAFT_3086661 [Pisolithus marmoratus]
MPFSYRLSIHNLKWKTIVVVCFSNSNVTNVGRQWRKLTIVSKNSKYRSPSGRWNWKRVFIYQVKEYLKVTLVVVYPYKIYQQKSIYVQSRSQTRIVFVFWRATVHEIDRRRRRSAVYLRSWKKLDSERLHQVDLTVVLGQFKAMSGMKKDNIEDILWIEEECPMDKAKTETKSRESELLEEIEVLWSRARRTSSPLIPANASIAEEMSSILLLLLFAMHVKVFVWRNILLLQDVNCELLRELYEMYC